MAMKIFVFFCFVLSLYFFLQKNENMSSKYTQNNGALVSFYDSVMYTFNDKYVTQYVKSSVAHRFNDKDELNNATIILRNQTTTVDNIDKIKANKIIIKDDIYEFDKDVDLNRNDELIVLSQKMYYDKIKKIAYNNVEFNGYYQKHKFWGDTLFLKQDEKFVTANNVEFKFDMKKGKK